MGDTDARREEFSHACAVIGREIFDLIESVKQGAPVTSQAAKAESGSEKLLSASEVAEMLGVSHRTIRKWAKDGKLPRVKSMAKLMFRPKTVQRLTENRMGPESNGR